jgi:hypothetical protein
MARKVRAHVRKGKKVKFHLRKGTKKIGRKRRMKKAY